MSLRYVNTEEKKPQYFFETNIAVFCFFRIVT